MADYSAIGCNFLLCEVSEVAKLKLLRCGFCGVFCDNHGNEFEVTEQLKAADKYVGFEDALGCCNKCKPVGLGDIAEEAEISEILAKQKDQFYRRHGAQC